MIPNLDFFSLLLVSVVNFFPKTRPLNMDIPEGVILSYRQSLYFTALR